MVKLYDPRGITLESGANIVVAKGEGNDDLFIEFNRDWIDEDDLSKQRKDCTFKKDGKLVTHIRVSKEAAEALTEVLGDSLQITTFKMEYKVQEIYKSLETD